MAVSCGQPARQPSTEFTGVDVRGRKFVVDRVHAAFNVFT